MPSPTKVRFLHLRYISFVLTTLQQKTPTNASVCDEGGKNAPRASSPITCFNNNVKLVEVSMFGSSATAQLPKGRAYWLLLGFQRSTLGQPPQHPSNVGLCAHHVSVLRRRVLFDSTRRRGVAHPVFRRNEEGCPLLVASLLLFSTQ